MSNLQVNSLGLGRGDYLAPISQTRTFGNLLLGITSYECSTETGVTHHHENSMLSYVLYGKNIERRNSSILERKQGTLSFYHPYQPHSNTYISFPSKHIAIELDNDFYAETGYSPNDIELAVRCSGNELYVFTHLMCEVLISDKESSTSAEMLFLSFLGRTLGGNEPSRFPKWMCQIQDILNDRWDETPSLSELSKLSNIHPVTISRNFRRYFNCSFGEYVRKLKVSHALRLMNSSQYSLTEITYNCGFSDQSHFTRTFKHMTGLLPKEYLKVK